MKFFLLLFICCFVTFCQGHIIPENLFSRRKREVSGALQIVTNGEKIHENIENVKEKTKNATDSSNPSQRTKREVTGALHIVTNNGQAIHEDVKTDISSNTAKVTAPQDVLFKGKSLRKSAPLTNKLELVRSINRLVTLFVLLVSAGIEFYPMLRHVYDIIALDF